MLHGALPRVGQFVIFREIVERQSVSFDCVQRNGIDMYISPLRDSQT